MQPAYLHRCLPGEGWLMPRLADAHCSVHLFTAQGRNNHMCGWLVTLSEAVALGIWAKMTLQASVAKKKR